MCKARPRRMASQVGSELSEDNDAGPPHEPSLTLATGTLTCSRPQGPPPQLGQGWPRGTWGSRSPAHLGVASRALWFHLTHVCPGHSAWPEPGPF